MPDGVRDFFIDWSSQFAMDNFSHDVSSEQLPCWTVCYRDVVEHIDVLESRLRGVLMSAQRL